jgi:hypothetical protein
VPGRPRPRAIGGTAFLGVGWVRRLTLGQDLDISGVHTQAPQNCSSPAFRCRAWTESRGPSIFGGTTEIMKEIIGRGLGL